VQGYLRGSSERLFYAVMRGGSTSLQSAIDEVLGEIEWRKHAEGMKVEGERYRSLSEVEKEIERLGENMGWTVERARSLYRTNPGAAKFLAHAY
jgi:hypothetical protein